jgi:hypothetical protein
LLPEIPEFPLPLQHLVVSFLPCNDKGNFKEGRKIATTDDRNPKSICDIFHLCFRSARGASGVLDDETCWYHFRQILLTSLRDEPCFTFTTSELTIRDNFNLLDRYGGIAAMILGTSSAQVSMETALKQWDAQEELQIGIPDLTEEQLDAILNPCKKLQKLSVVCGPQLKLLDVTKLPNLKELHVEKCSAGNKPSNSPLTIDMRGSKATVKVFRDFATRQAPITVLSGVNLSKQVTCLTQADFTPEKPSSFLCFSS